MTNKASCKTTIFAYLLTIIMGAGALAGSLLAQCSQKSLNRADGTVATVYNADGNSLPIGTNGQVQIGAFLMEIDNQLFISIIARHQSPAIELAQTLQITTLDNNSIELPLRSEEVVFAGGSAVANGIYTLDVRAAGILRTSPINNLSVRTTNGVKHLVEATYNADLIQKSLKCALRVSPGKSEIARIPEGSSPLDKRYGFQVWKLDSHSDTIKNCNPELRSDQITSVCQASSGGKIGELPYRSVYLTFIDNILSEIEVSLEPRYRDQLIVAARSAYGVEASKSIEDWGSEPPQRKSGVVWSSEGLLNNVNAKVTSWQWLGADVHLRIRDVSLTDDYIMSENKKWCDRDIGDHIYQLGWYNEYKRRGCVNASLTLRYSVANLDKRKETSLKNKYDYSPGDF